MALNNSLLMQKTNELWDKFRSEGLADSFTAVEQITCLLFMKHLEDRSADANTKHSSIFKGKFKSNSKAISIDRKLLRWSYFTQMGAKEMLDHVAVHVFPFIKSIPDNSFSKSIAGTTFLVSRPSLLTEAVRLIEDIHVLVQQSSDGRNNTLGDVYGLLFRQISTSLPDRILAPQHIVRMMVEMLDPNYTDIVCDPSCGTGRYLISVYRFILYKNDSAIGLIDEDGFEDGGASKLSDPKDQVKLETKVLTGFDSDPRLVSVAIMNLMLHGIPNPEINHVDVLSRQYDEYERRGQYTKILATAPFRGSIDENWRSSRLGKSTKTEILFLEQVINMLKLGGTASVVVSEGMLYGGSSTYRDIREKLLRDCRLNAVIAMPAGIFKPASAVASAVLIFTKGKQVNSKEAGNWLTQQVWFYRMAGDGYSLDDDRKPLLDKPLPTIARLFSEHVVGRKSDSDRTNDHFFVSIADLIAADLDLNMDRYQELNIEHARRSAADICADLIREEESLLIEMKALMSLIND